MGEIARSAGINKALIYRAFDSKEELFVLTVASYLAELEGRCAELPEGEDPAAALRAYLERLCRILPRLPCLPRLRALLDAATRR